MAEHTIESDQPKKAPETRDVSRYLVPQVDIYENGEGLVLLADLPGVTPEGLDLEVEEDILTIKGTIEPSQPAGEITQQREFELASYYRQFQLNDQVDLDRIEARLEAGILHLHLPRHQPVGARKISVQVG